MTSQKILQNRILVWNLLGSLFSVGISVLLLLVVVRLLPNKDADLFSFAYALGNLFIIIGHFQVRDYQATDINEKFTFNQYFWTRMITILMMVLLSVFYIFVRQLAMKEAIVLLLICLYRGSDALSDVFQGMFQKKFRLDIAGQSLFYRMSIVASVFTIVLIATRDLILSLLLMTGCSFLFIILFDFKKIRNYSVIQLSGVHFSNIKGILKDCFPLFINAFLLVTTYNQPKYALNYFFDKGLIEVGVQKYFSSLFMPVFALNAVLILFRPLLTQLAVYRANNEDENFKKYRFRLIQIIILLAIVILPISSVAGIPVLNLLYGVNLNKYWGSFIILMVGGLASTFATICDNLLTIERKQKYLVISYVLSCITSIFIANPLVERYEMLGAAITFCGSMWVWFIISFGIYLFVQGKEKSS